MADLPQRQVGQHTVDELSKEALDGGASVHDVDNIRSRYGAAPMGQGPSEAPADIEKQLADDFPQHEGASMEVPQVATSEPREERELEISDNVLAALQGRRPVTNEHLLRFAPRINDPILKHHKTQQLAMFGMSINPDLTEEEAFNQAQATLANSGSYDEAVDGYKRQITQIMNADWREHIRTADPEDIVSFAEFQRDHDLYEAYEGKLGEEKLFADEYSLSLDEEQEANQVVQNYAMSMVQDIMDEQGVGVSDYLGLIFWPNFTLGVSDLMDAGLFSTPGEFSNFAEAFQTATPDQKASIVEEFVPRAFEALDNPLKAATAVTLLFDHEARRSMTGHAVLEILDVGFIGWDIISLGAAGAGALGISRALRARNTVGGSYDTGKKLVDLGNKPEAARRTVVDRVQEGQPSARSDLSRSQEVDPFDHSRTMVGDMTLDGLSDQHVRLFEAAQAQRLKSPFVRSYVSEMELDRLQAFIRGQKAALRNATRTVTRMERQIAAGSQRVSHNQLAKAQQRVQNYSENIDDATAALRHGRYARSKADSQVELELGQLHHVTDPDLRPYIAGRVQHELRTLQEADTIGEAVAAGASRSAVLRSVQAMRQHMKDIIQDVREVTPVFRDAAERAAAERRAIERMQAEAEDAGRPIQSIRMENVTDEGYTATIRYEDGSEVRRGTFTEDDLGGYYVEIEDIHVGAITDTLSHAMSPEHLMDSVSANRGLGAIVRDATWQGNQAERVRKAINQVGRTITKGLSRREKRQLDRLIIASDEASTDIERLFTVGELTRGIETARGLERFGEKVINSYYQMHLFTGELKRFMDDSIRRTLEFRGYQNLNFVDQATMRQAIVRPKRMQDWNPDPREKVMIYDRETGTWNTTPSADVIARSGKYNDYTLAEIFHKTTDSEGNVTSHILFRDGTDSAEITRLPDNVLNKTPGMYVPRVYKPGMYFVRDLQSNSNATRLAFETRRDAVAYAKRHNTSAKAHRFEVFQDGDMGFEDALSQMAQGYGGLYSSPRKKQNLMYVASGKDPETQATRPPRLGGFDSMQRYIDATAGMMPRDKQRIAVLKRFKNQVDAHARTVGRQQGFVEPGNPSAGINLPEGPEKRLYERTFDYIQGTYGQMGTQERLYQQAMRGFAEFLEKGRDIPVVGQVTELGRRFAIDVANADIRRKLIGTTFDLHLGWFNSSQLYVQTQNAALALSAHPVHGVTAIPKALAARAILFGATEKDVGALTKVALKGMGINQKEFQDTLMSFKRSGMFESVMRVADYGGKLQGIGGTALDTYRAAARTGRVMYEEGELMGRLISWFVARDTLADAAKKAGRTFDPTSTDGARQLTDETYRLMMNMQRENAAWWQQNWLAVPLQFAQVQAKLLENTLPVALGGTTRLTPAEKTRIMAGQMALYGFVGVPMFNQAYNYVTDFLGVDPAEVQADSPNAHKFLQQGVVGLSAQAMGFDNNFADRGSIIKGLDENAFAGLLKGTYNMIRGQDEDEFRLSDHAGAGLNTISRARDAGQQIFNSIRTLYTFPEAPIARDEFLKSLDSIAQMTSTWSNIQRTQYLYEIGLYSSRGNELIAAEEFQDDNLQTYIARAIGFPTNREAAYYNRQAAIFAHRREHRHIQDAVQERMVRFMREGGDVRVYQNDIRIITAGMNELERDRMMHRVMENAADPTTAQDRQLHDLQRMFLSGALESTPVEVIE